MKVIANQMPSGKQHLVAGQEYDVSEETAKLLIKNGQARDASEPEPPAKKKKSNLSPIS